jgi:hypothetical protein
MTDTKLKTVNFNVDSIAKLPKDKPVVKKIKNKQGENIYNVGLGVGPSQINTSQGIGPKSGLFFDLKRMFLGLKKGF